VISRGFYALGCTWLPTIVGTAIAFLLVPLYVELRQQMDAVGLAIASAIAILLYVLLLGWLQHRRFKREAAARGATLENVPSMLGGALRLGMAAAIATVAGLLLRSVLVRHAPGAELSAILIRATLLCVGGVGVYVAAARALGITELSEIAGVLHDALGLKRHSDVQTTRFLPEGLRKQLSCGGRSRIRSRLLFERPLRRR